MGRAMLDILVVGSLHYDIVIAAPHLPAVDETVMGGPVQYVCGGKGGNQAISASRHGASVAFAGAVGDDPSGTALLANLSDAGVNTEQVQSIPGASGMSVAIVDAQGDYGAVVASGANQRIEADAIAVPVDTSCVVLQNEIPASVNLSVAQQAKDATVILNAAPMRILSPALLNCVDILIVNRVEAEALFGMPIASQADAARALAAHELDVARIIVTLGSDGLVYCENARGSELGVSLQYASAAAAVLVSTPVCARSAITRESVEQLL